MSIERGGYAGARTGARRLAVIKAVDVVGYSRLMGEDEAGTVAEHGGAPCRRFWLCAWGRPRSSGRN
jgi:hypothetical protein